VQVVDASPRKTEENNEVPTKIQAGWSWNRTEKRYHCANQVSPLNMRDSEVK